MIIFALMMSRVPKRVINSDKESGISEAIYWNSDQVARWLVSIGFPQYEECFRKNFVTGRKLIVIDAAALPSMGVQDFEHIKIITKCIRTLIHIPKLHNNRAIAMRDPNIAYLELKRRTGKTMDNKTFKAFLSENRRFFPKKN